ncbi:hypothetical protein COO91_00153 [Nostoc flagelliforme CCNUN1]|uniref:Uncharacterized protein n=1 Tax=Nostoc flagelliforme CCNUN1 TaxID=2038116 RepID=A0A2K8SGD5_9NOSO|nr:hypothetical protein COO91_00153 [Nostoc flagelliforme CCNUN1]
MTPYQNYSRVNSFGDRCNSSLLRVVSFIPVSSNTELSEAIAPLPGTIATSPPQIPDFIGKPILTANWAEASYNPQVDITALTIRRFCADKQPFSQAKSFSS